MNKNVIFKFANEVDNTRLLEWLGLTEPGMTSSRVFLIFLICAFIGWICEVLYVGIFYEKKFVNRGFLHGPVCPIYGIGGLVVLFFFTPWKDTWVALFFASFVILSAIEYFGSWILEKFFHTKWWDYSKEVCNLNGRVCLKNSILFGLMGVAGMHFLRPAIFGFLLSIDDKIIDTVAFGLFIVFSVDLLTTVRRLVDFSTAMERFKAFDEQLREKFENEPWFKNGNFRENLASIRERSKINANEFKQSLLEKLSTLEAQSKKHESLIKKFPTMKSNEYGFFVEGAKAYLDSIKNKK